MLYHYLLTSDNINFALPVFWKVRMCVRMCVRVCHGTYCVALLLCQYFYIITVARQQKPIASRELAKCSTWGSMKCFYCSAHCITVE